LESQNGQSNSETAIVYFKDRLLSKVYRAGFSSSNMPPIKQRLLDLLESISGDHFDLEPEPASALHLFRLAKTEDTAEPVLAQVPTINMEHTIPQIARLIRIQYRRPVAQHP